jgi:hypothetical protein
MSAEIDAALERVFQVMEERPEKNTLNHYADLEAGRRPRGCPVSLGRVQHWREVPETDEEKRGHFDPPEKQVLDGLRGIPGPLEMNNNFQPVLGSCGVLPSVASAFGITCDIANPRNPGGVTGYLPLETFDDFDPPDINTAGVWPRVKEQIDCIKAQTPPEIKIGYPDLQGPVNTAHLILGTQLFYAMKLEPARLHHLLQLITDFYLEIHRTLPVWIGPDRMINFIGATHRLAECSVNLISREAYREFGLPYDRQIAEFIGEIGIHTCGGKHVFEETLRGLPNVRYTEWCDVPSAFAPEIHLEAALEEIGDRPIIISGGRELWDGDFETKIHDDLARLDDHPLQSFGYSGMRWREPDKPRIIAMRQRIDDYYAARWG